MGHRSVVFAGGGTGGHIYPALALAQRIATLDRRTDIRFFCSTRPIDARILSRSGFAFVELPAQGLSCHPGKLLRFVRTFARSYARAREHLENIERGVVVGVGGFVAGPVCLAASRLGLPVALVNVDYVPGRANKLAARWASDIFVQFEQTRSYVTARKARVHVTGCPLRAGFSEPAPQRIRQELRLARDKHVLLITGASSGAASINEAVCSLLSKLDGFAETWQIVHLTGLAKLDAVRARYRDVKIDHTVLGYCDDMPDLLAAADLVVGRSGAVSVAEYAAAHVPCICLPYPHHKDRHQYLNAQPLVEAGAGVIVDDVPDAGERARRLWAALERLMRDDARRGQMRQACEKIGRRDASEAIAERLLAMASPS